MTVALPLWYNTGTACSTAKALKTYDKLLLASGKIVSLEKITVEQLETPENTYNFEVADFHTYYVSKQNVLVHNKGCKNSELYRGGKDMTLKPGEYRLDKNGLVKTTHGLSVNANPRALARFGDVYKVQNIPKGLKVIQRGQDVLHFEIVPQKAMTLEKYQALLYQVELSLI